VLSPDEGTMYVANTRSSQYIHAIRLDAAGNMVGRSIFADLNEGGEPGIPDGLKVDSIGRVYCTGPFAVHEGAGCWCRVGAETLGRCERQFVVHVRYGRQDRACRTQREALVDVPLKAVHRSR
jgi:hypothetical protein